MIVAGCIIFKLVNQLRPLVHSGLLKDSLLGFKQLIQSRNTKLDFSGE